MPATTEIRIVRPRGRWTAADKAEFRELDSLCTNSRQHFELIANFNETIAKRDRRSAPAA